MQKINQKGRDAERIGQELRKFFDMHAIPYKEVAERIQITRASLSNIFAGRDALGKVRAKKLADAYGFDYIFLLTGEGELLSHSPSIHQSIEGSHNVQVAEVKPSACPSAEELMSRIDQLERTLADKDKEVAFLRDMVGRLIPSGKLQ